MTDQFPLDEKIKALTNMLSLAMQDSEAPTLLASTLAMFSPKDRSYVISALIQAKGAADEHDAPEQQADSSVVPKRDWGTKEEAAAYVQGFMDAEYRQQDIQLLEQQLQDADKESKS